MKKFSKVAVLFAVVCLSLSACGNSNKNNAADTNQSQVEEDNASGETGTVKEGEAAPDITFTLMDGTEKKLSDYQGKPVVMNFWATWCKPCVGEMPAFEKLKENYGEDITVLALDCGGDTKEAIEDFVSENGYTFEFAEISDDEASKYDVQGIPLTIIIDADGIVKYMNMGASDADSMYTDHYEPAVKELLGIN